jgi:acylphosphatase
VLAKDRNLAPHLAVCNTESDVALIPTFMVQHYLVKGRVQGVGFRWFVHREAAELGLRGWVRNTEDGHVEVVAAGDAEDLAALHKALRKGSRGSRVDAVLQNELVEAEAEGLGPFQIEGAW